MKKKVLIIGAGFAGIGATIQAIEQGCDVLVIEGRPYIGGRARSFIDKDTGEIIDNGQHVMMGCYGAVLHILRRLGTEQLLYRQKALSVTFFDQNGEADILDAGYLPGKLGIAVGILMLKKLSWQSRMQALMFAVRLRLMKKQSVGETSLEFLRRMNQTEESIRRLWEPLILATLNAHPSTADATLLIEVLQRAFFGGREASQMLIPRNGLSELLAPFVPYVQSHGGQVMLSTSVESLKYHAETSTVSVIAEGKEYHADTIISCIPSFALQRIASPSLLGEHTYSLLGDMVFSPIVSLYLWFDRDFMGDIRFCALLQTVTQWVFNRRLLCECSDELREQYPGHIALTISAGTQIVGEQAESVVALCLEELRRCFPGASDATLLSWKVIKEKQATFLAIPPIEARRPEQKTYAKNFFLAGDWTKTGLPATLEGAAQSGIDAIVYAHKQ